jgi:L-asparagine transporter-like permease
MESLADRILATVIISFLAVVGAMIFTIMRTWPKLFNLTPSQTSQFNWDLGISQFSLNFVDWADLLLTALAVAIAVTAYLKFFRTSSWEDSAIDDL